MARKSLFDSNDTLADFIGGLNDISDYQEDLDDLHKAGDYLPGFADVNRDNNFVQAANWLYEKIDIIDNTLFGGDSGDSDIQLRFEKTLVSDSAVIRRLQVNKLSTIIDSSIVLRDSLDSSFGYHDSFGAWVLPPYTQFHRPIPQRLNVTIDSAYLNNFTGGYLRVGEWHCTDSELYPFYNPGDSLDSGDSIGNWAIRFDSNPKFGLFLDSGHIVNLSGPGYHFPFPHCKRGPWDSGYTNDSSSLRYDSAKFGIFKLATDSSYYFDSSNDPNFRQDSSFFLSDQPWGQAITATPGIIKLNGFALDFDARFVDSVNFGYRFDSADSGFNIYFTNRLDSGRIIWHDSLGTTNEVDNHFRYTSLLTIYSDSIDPVSFQPVRLFGGYLISQYDSDGRL